MIMLFTSPVVDASAGRTIDQGPLFPPVIDPNDLLPANGGDGRVGFVVNGAFSNQLFGMAVALGDFDGDGRDDLLTGFVPNAPPAIAPPSGAALLFGRSTVPMEPGGLETLPFFPNAGATSDLLRLMLPNASQFAGAMGWRARNLGDLDGDGFPELAVVLFGRRVDQVPSLGMTFILYGGPTIADRFVDFAGLLPEAGGDGQDGFVLVGSEEGDLVGKDIAGTGDMNGDGWTDLLVLSDRRYAPERLRGTAYVIYGRPGRSLPAETTLDELLAQDASRGFAILAPIPEAPPKLDFEFQGARLVPDLNGDGLDDIVLCRSRNQFSDTNANGECYVVFGRRGSAPFPAKFDLGDLLARNGGDGTQGFVIVGTDESTLGSPDAQANRNGYGFDGIGDFDGDGYNDLLVGVPNFNAIGYALLFFGQSQWPAEIDLRQGLEQARMHARITRFDRFFSPPASRLGFGSSVGAVGDLNSDGLPDIAIIAEPPVTENTGAWIIFGSRNPPENFVVETLLPEYGGDGRRGFLVQNFLGEFDVKLGMGHSMAGGDFNGDGIDDVALGSWLANPGDRGNAGRVVVLYGRGPISREIPALGGVGLGVLVFVLLAVAVRRLRRSEN